ncbi:hypothetical protein CB0101_13530 [Synechococcus sp. CB0101]|uniref:calcium-binding protein n=1 Tax=Synechococcus sp. CB0101 TaxID=232348 RepID=UPI0010AA2E1A|nr:choice-of-anchor U domain-containing protein [Synechococcus sp. CB0101]QCH15793.1 hypothetical protein CB0101_13530 [Synechococcus sp. CB0101]
MHIAFGCIFGVELIEFMPSSEIVTYDPSTSEDIFLPAFGNEYLRFGTGTNALNDQTGSLSGPQYWDGSSWLNGTIGISSFAMGVGSGGDGADIWNLNGNLYYGSYLNVESNSTNESGATFVARRKPDTLFSVDTSGLDGTTGSFTWSGIFELEDSTAASGDGKVDVKISRTYKLGANSSYVKETTTIENVDAQDTLTNPRFWTGVGDDWVGFTDSPDKIKGNIVEGEFVPISSLDSDGLYVDDNRSIRATAVLIGQSYPGVGTPIEEVETDSLFEYFYTTSPNGYALVHESIGWYLDRAMSRDPLDSPSIINQDDGSYAMYYRFDDLDPGFSASVDTFFAMSPLSQLGSSFLSVESDSEEEETVLEEETSRAVESESPVPAPVPVVDTTPADPAPAGVDIQPADDDGDGLREVVTAADGTTVDGNRDGIADATQSQVAGLRLINDGAVGADYGAVVVPDGIQLQAVTLVAPAAGSSIQVAARGGGAVVTTTPEGINNAFAGVVSFNAAGMTPGGTTEVTISFPSGLPAGTGNAYLRFNYVTNRFEEYLDANGTPLYAFIDNDGDGTIDGVKLTVIDGDLTWDGDGTPNGVYVDPGFLGSGERNLTGTKRGDSLIGNVLANTLNGKKGNDWLVGDLASDVLKGARGNDGIFGGEGADRITGGQDRDRIYYTDASESSVDQRDTVKFGKQDRFVFSSFDGDTITEGIQTLSFIGKQAFSGTAGELRATRSVLEADTTGDGFADFVVNLLGNTLISASNLVL